ncbi:MAG: Lrp/AsnC family transcriptional regulator [Candidatus Thermoplasmatota archaeon]|jgi:DNA-binding Lrp family transcriptional regulator|nr:Lrp/AsnC family transcriptional regulator [Candidatus Sysuiplasma jiujiangense]MBX8640450.1 Lrp/AsnC family transcriptional regulator [Candidatus Sysuiplasma jiujiangense]MBX8641667.1 Lrp/AsnC family transcriptional regulator [Candidatus Sysuiplasma jiujiangense]MCL5253898.1 Lrp/AsnC family transcriptional regulator [Candidatus Thermoplasmatota archaeon]
MTGIEGKELQKKVVIRVIDDIDSQILSLLRENARMKNVEIARHVNLTEGGVRARIAKMVNDHIIERFTIVTRSNQISGLVLIKTQLDQTKIVIKRLKEISSSVYETSGEFDVASEMSADTVEQLNQKVDEIRSFPGVLETMTLIKMS